MVAKADPRDGHESHDEFQTLLTRIFITLHVTDDKSDKIVSKIYQGGEIYDHIICGVITKGNIQVQNRTSLEIKNWLRVLQSGFRLKYSQPSCI